jgi:hypothetical protein
LSSRKDHPFRAESLSNNPGVGPRPSEDKPGKERRRGVSAERYVEEARRGQAQPQPAEASRDYCSGSEQPERFGGRLRGLPPERFLAADSGAPASARPRLLERLPAFYREHPGVLEPLLEVAEDLLGTARRAFVEAEGRLAAPVLAAPVAGKRGGWSSLFAEPAAGGGGAPGTLSGILSLLAEKVAAAPRVWPGREAVEIDAVVELQRSEGPAVVLAWSREETPGAPRGIDLPEGVLPVGVTLALVRLEKLPWEGVPPHGARAPGEIIWRQGSVRQ